MMKDVKKYLRLVKYSRQFVVNIVMAVSFVLLGMMWLFENDFMFVMGGFYVVLGPFYIVQSAQALVTAEMIASSPKKRNLEIHFANVLQLVGILFSVLIILGMIGIRYIRVGTMSSDAFETGIDAMLVVSGFGIIGLITAFNMLQNNTWLGILVLILTWMGVGLFLHETVNNWLVSTFGGNIRLGIAVFVAEVLLGYILTVLVRYVSYRKSPNGLAMEKQMF